MAVVGERVEAVIGRMNRRRFILKFARVMGTTALLATMLHGFEAFLWASAYRIVGALPDNRAGMLYSLSAMTTYGHANLFLQDRWQMMGALEALNGMLLFGLTTAFMFGMMQRSLAVRSQKATAYSPLAGRFRRRE